MRRRPLSSLSHARFQSFSFVACFSNTQLFLSILVSPCSKCEKHFLLPYMTFRRRRRFSCLWADVSHWHSRRRRHFAIRRRCLALSPSMSAGTAEADDYFISHLRKMALFFTDARLRRHTRPRPRRRRGTQIARVTGTFTHFPSQLGLPRRPPDVATPH